MIRIGFTAILVLLMIYIFRFFFVPRVSSIDELLKPEGPHDKAANSGSSLSNSEGNVLDKKTSTSLSENQISEMERKIEELSVFKGETVKLRVQLNEAESSIFDLKAQLIEAQKLVAQPNEGQIDPEVLKKINQKNEQLEARLAEYEIIAEEISEISQIRKENIELKQKLGMNTANEKVMETVSEVLSEIADVEVPVVNKTLTVSGADSIIEDFFAMEAEEEEDVSVGKSPVVAEEEVAGEVLENALLENALIEALGHDENKVGIEAPKNVDIKLIDPELSELAQVASDEVDLINQFETMLSKKES